MRKGMRSNNFQRKFHTCVHVDLILFANYYHVQKYERTYSVCIASINVCLSIE